VCGVVLRGWFWGVFEGFLMCRFGAVTARMLGAGLLRGRGRFDLVGSQRTVTFA
jgi:hypothetical protein